MKRITLFILLIPAMASAQDLVRRASWDASIVSPENGKPGAKIHSIIDGSPLDRAGLLAGDVILQVDERRADTDESWTSITYALRSGSRTRLMIKRGSQVLEKSVELQAIEKESHEGIDTSYEWIVSDYGIKQRVIITRPKNRTGRQPALVMIGGLSCSTLETYPGRSGNWPTQINDFIEKTGMVVMRVDKPGVGDSEGDCAETDFITELSGYRAGIRALKTKAYVDTTRIVVYGSSMGSALAPLLANEFNLAGVIADGTFFKTWYEHMLEIERRIRKMSGDDERTIARKMNEAFIPLYYGMLIQKKTYEEVVNEYPAIKASNYHSPRHMYGRPVAYYQQLQDFDLAGEWERLKAPVRILYGLNDWIMSESDNDMIIKVLDASGHEDHKLVKYPGLDHWNTIHETPDDSFYGKPGKWDQKVSDIMTNWAIELGNNN
ncbi:MAG: alpha/beta fold hydrolase [Cyclobacteriaceae bacterium]